MQPKSAGECLKGALSTPTVKGRRDYRGKKTGIDKIYTIRQVGTLDGDGLEGLALRAGRAVRQHAVPQCGASMQVRFFALGFETALVALISAQSQYPLDYWHYLLTVCLQFPLWRIMLGTRILGDKPMDHCYEADFNVYSFDREEPQCIDTRTTTRGGCWAS